MKGLVFIGLLALGATAHAVVIDDFLTGGYNSGAITSGTVNNWSVAASAMGGIRYDSLTVTANPLLGDSKCRVITNPGVLEVSSDTEVDINFILGYGYANSSTTPTSNPLNKNFTSSPIIQLDFRTNDQNMPVTVTLYTNGGANSFTRTATVVGGIFSQNPSGYQFDFTSDAASLGDVDGIKIFFDPASSGDFSLNSVEAVPEPMSLTVLSLGALALLRRRKK